jgi:cell wall-associated NlpC family hydrolase
LTLALITNVTPVQAVPQSKSAQARAVKAEIDSLDHKVEAAAERYNEARAKHRALTAQRKKAAAKHNRLKKRMGVVQRHLNTRAGSMYRSGPMGFVDVLLGAESFEEFATTWEVLRDLNSGDAAAIEELRVLRSKAAAAKKELQEKERAAGKQATLMAANKRSIEGQLAQRQSKLRGLEAEIAAIEAQEERARSAAAGSWARTPDRSFPAPSRAPRSDVVSVARRYLGAPYRWAASGPNSFDCSGFTMFVYRQVGVSLPHSSRAQIHVGERVSRSDLAPGDLVFFGSPIHHVGMYVGGGMYIHSPRTGDVVKISSMSRSGYAGASRP